MIKVVAKAVYRKDKVEQAKELFAKLIEETKKEQGCLAYDLYQDIQDNTVLTMIERWESLECLEKHGKEEHYTRIIPTIRSYRISSDVNIYEKALPWI